MPLFSFNAKFWLATPKAFSANSSSNLAQKQNIAKMTMTELGFELTDPCDKSLNIFVIVCFWCLA